VSEREREGDSEREGCMERERERVSFSTLSPSLKIQFDDLRREEEEKTYWKYLAAPTNGYLYRQLG
jgi:hypothetical protein